MIRLLRCLLLLLAAGTLALAADTGSAAAGARYELFPEPEEHWSPDHRTTSAYVLDKQASRFWICTARYNFYSDRDNEGDCRNLPVGTGRPALTPAHEVRAVTGSPLISASLPLFWFIEPTSGDVQFCAPRHPGVCVQIKLPQ
jgi:hypothetical protein